MHEAYHSRYSIDAPPIVGTSYANFITAIDDCQKGVLLRSPRFNLAGRVCHGVPSLSSNVVKSIEYGFSAWRCFFTSLLKNLLNINGTGKWLCMGAEYKSLLQPRLSAQEADDEGFHTVTLSEKLWI